MNWKWQPNRIFPGGEWIDQGKLGAELEWTTVVWGVEGSWIIEIWISPTDKTTPESQSHLLWRSQPSKDVNAQKVEAGKRTNFLKAVVL